MAAAGESVWASLRRIGIVLLLTLPLWAALVWFSPAWSQKREMDATERWAEEHVTPRIAGDPRFGEVRCRAGTMDGAPLFVAGTVASVADVRALRAIVAATKPPMRWELTVSPPEGFYENAPMSEWDAWERAVRGAKE